MDRHLTFERLHNFRDLGGYPTRDGATVRWGRLYRSDSLGKLAGADLDRFLALGVGTVIDLRYPWEIDAAGRAPEHPSYTWHNLSVEHRPYDQAALGPDVAPGPYLAERYLEVAHDGAAELRRALDVIAGAGDGPEPGAVVFHCASGKDRTGLLAALVLTLLDVEQDVVVEDFTLTERATARLVADWRAGHPGRELAWPAYGTAPADVMSLFLDGLARRHGSVSGYAEKVLGVDDALVAALRRNLLEPVPVA
ncbi:tyrosine-protein phosphatase [Streptomyces huiliensis]|uniref:tyrosine-protein phosphatase n=1 Tax=Streptomyces huiliensis TaxID=2876027 RepID=UPI001CBE7B0B|nr:tyrosine-protein phosphatase [Streptomyces huiliensis]MBZ4320488.1 tyrosine-protein phosphatase [Streptomyces huiliensis]